MISEISVNAWAAQSAARIEWHAMTGLARCAAGGKLVDRADREEYFPMPGLMMRGAA